jgi:hypothetical protein
MLYANNVFHSSKLCKVEHTINELVNKMNEILEHLASIHPRDMYEHVIKFCILLGLYDFSDCVSDYQF